MTEYPIAVLVGSLRRESFNRKLAQAIAKLAPPAFSFRELRIDDLPPYNQDDDADQAEPVKRLKSEIGATRGLLFVTAEYNRSIPGVLKNAIDPLVYDGKLMAAVPAAMDTAPDRQSTRLHSSH